MKKMLLIAVLLSTGAMARDVDQRSFEECTKQCTIYSYTFQPDFLNQCRQTESCTIYEWDDENNQCVVKERNVLATYPIQCRDIPPAY